MHFHSVAPPCFGRQTRALGLAISGLLLFALGAAAAELSGEWEAQFGFGLGPQLCEMEGELSILWTGVGWDVEGVFEFERSTWAQLDVETSVELDPIGFSWSIRWDAIDRCFERLTLATWVEREDIEIDADFDLYKTRCWTDLRAQYDLEPCEIDVKIRLGASKSFSFDFYRLDVAVSSEIRGIPVDVEARWTAKKGFEWVDIEALVSPLQELPGLEIEVETRFTRTGRERSFEPVLEVRGGLRGGIELARALQRDCHGRRALHRRMVDRRHDERNGVGGRVGFRAGELRPDVEQEGRRGQGVRRCARIGLRGRGAVRSLSVDRGVGVCHPPVRCAALGSNPHDHRDPPDVFVDDGGDRGVGRRLGRRGDARCRARMVIVAAVRAGV